MRFKSYSLFSAIFLSLLLLWLNVEQTITRYVHPRYVIFTVVMALISLALLAVSISYKHSQKSSGSKLLLLFALLVTSVPAFSLSERTASSRLQQSFTKLSTEQISFDSFSFDYSHFDIADWVSLISTAAQPSDVVDKKARVEGFIFSDQDNQKYIARFKLSCCAVDATPLSIAVNDNAQTGGLVDGKWYAMEGSFVLSTNGDFVLDPTKVEEIEEPADPYVF